MRIDKTFLPDDINRSIAQENAKNINRYLQHWKSLEEQIDHLKSRQKDQEQSLLKRLPYKKGTVINVVYPNKEVGSDQLRIIDINVDAVYGIDLDVEVIKHTKKGKEKKHLRKRTIRHDEFSKLNKIILWEPE